MFHKRTTRLTAVVLFLILGAALASFLSAAEKPVVIPAPSVDNPKAAGPLQKAVLSGGCFWGVQGVYQHVRGVRQVLSGYSGGEKATAQYEVVSSGRTGHAESVQIIFDPKEVSYGEILQVYFSVVHDPTQLNRQGPDSGTQYRSNIFFADESQKKIAEAYITQLNEAKVFRKPIVTRVDPLKAFYPAEGYHQDFLINNPDNPYIEVNDLPKIDNLKKVFPGIYQATPVTVRGSK